MDPEVVEIARAETERGDVVLRRRSSAAGADVLELRVNGVFVMDTLETTSEIELAAQALELVDEPRSVVIGGLGLGFTLQRVLADPRVERAVVVEIEEPLVQWMREGTVPHGPAILADQRVSIVNADIAMAVAEARSTYDLVLLDVDNGPGYLVHEANEAVYEVQFLRRCRELLSPGGVLVVWSGNPAPDLLDAMREVFGSAEEQRHDVLLQDRPEGYYLYLARAT
ncbi:spermidine synthase [Microbacterium sp. ARD31]|uniref:spermidine synthase n=1 Tax=Microbacterium sp. ARD31 TaxID=2962576 RepID=UPI002882826B|nr:spermidine synthase [Microbacterium sp. ARD31]MDT0188284.1 spermidine synthase [Microbacterium sp. ARD31]